MPGADGKIHPYLAKSVVGTANNTVWTITLRPGIKFHDGTPLDAQVVKDNLDALPQGQPALHVRVRRRERRSTSSTR